MLNIPSIILIFPTVEFITFFILSFSLWFSTKHKLIAICIFNVVFYGLYSPTMLFYLLGWVGCLYVTGKYLKLKYLLISFALIGLAFWKMVEAKWFVFTPSPLGISFFIFQGLTYVFARIKLPKHKPEEHIENYWGFLKLLGFVGFFPTIFSGPIIRAKLWENNLNNLSSLNQKNFSRALLLISVGAFYKLCLSSIFHDYVSLAYSNPQEENAINLFIGFYAYTFEIYHDFAGYSLMAIGISLLYGFDLPENFKQPYLSINIKDFWQKWHISFSFWLRDYFYFSLGGSKDTKYKHLRNAMIVMIVCGAWHGLNSNYLIWGALHGIAVVFFHLIKNKIKLNFVISWFVTFNYIALSWVFFRSPNAVIAYNYIKGLFHFNDYLEFNSKNFMIILLFIFAFFCQVMEKHIFSKEQQFNNIIFSSIFSPILWGSITILILMASPSGMPPFIYFSY